MRQIVFSVLFMVFIFTGPAAMDVQCYDTEDSGWIGEDSYDWQRAYEPNNVSNNQQPVTALPTPVAPTVNQQQIVVQPRPSQRAKKRGILSVIFPWLAREQNTSGPQQPEPAVSQSRQTAVQPGLTQPLQPNLAQPRVREQGAYPSTPSIGRSSGLIKPRIGSYGPGSSSSSYVVDLRKRQPSATQSKSRRAASPRTQSGLIKPTIQGSGSRR